MSAPLVHLFPCLNDNYGFLLHDPDFGMTASVDTPEVGPILQALDERGWQLTHIFNTHHHWDHAGGNLELKERTGCTIIGPRADADRIPGIDVKVGEGDRFEFGLQTIAVSETPGHTRGHIVFHLPEHHIAFVGDTLFAMGCGRLFEGSPEQMWDSLQKILAWPDATRIYCAHEYTQANARFALTVDPANEDLQQRATEVDAYRAENRPTVPTTLALEKQTNPFLRADAAGIRQTLEMENARPVDVFARVRALKDAF
ncbi:hydroxyacylglutathione hydrolase [Methylohalomonas lacus]|uniref:Hydroxyacylglutathione hydrolase n=1 Tax=Methylohalomonas lacus TaxID=398773 RepID=A0AAE3HPM3_9GAMM|nr:hydroxyacylglutathione hydrolase [Methylohalomonas lacus]MCS3904633.1 hydroxyacylglutathione hydrolase [Methylohalomonas lacus]